MTNAHTRTTPAGQIEKVSFDANHQAILNHIEILLGNIGVDDQFISLSTQVKQLLPLMLEHFIEEEQYMRDIRYPDAPTHALFHSQILGDVSYAFELLQQATPADLQSRIKALMQNLVEHFSSEDCAFEAFVQSQRPAEK